MKKSNLNENNFETSHVTKTLVDNGYFERLPDNYNQELFLDTEILLNFVKNTQPEEWEKIQEQYPENTEDIFLKRVAGEISKRGTLDVLRNGIKDRGAKFELPSSMRKCNTWRNGLIAGTLGGYRIHKYGN